MHTKSNSIIEIKKVEKTLKWGTRLYYIYSAILFVFIQIMFYFSWNVDPPFFIIMFSIQAGLLINVFETYKTFFSISPILKQKFTLRVAFFLWLIIFLLFNIELIIMFPIFSGGVLVLLTKNEAFVTLGSLVYKWFSIIFLIILGASGEYLLNKIHK